MMKGMISMSELLLTARSSTYAQQMKKIIERSGISAEIVRPDISITKGDCAYAVKMSPVFSAEVMEVLNKYRVTPVRVVLFDGKGYRELRI